MEDLFEKLSNRDERPVADSVDTLPSQLEKDRMMWIKSNVIGTKVLDIGCSTGYLSTLLSDDIKYFGLDYSKEAVEYAEEKHGHRKNVSFKQMNLNDMKFVDTPIADTIIAAEVLEHLENGLDFIPRLRKMCKRLIITVPYAEMWYWEHHKIRNIREDKFQGADIVYYHENTHTITKQAPRNLHQNNKANIFAIYDQGVEYDTPKPIKTLTAYVCTKGRYDTTLPLTIQSIIFQTVTPDTFIIIDDNLPNNRIEYEKNPLYNKLFSIARANGIEIHVLYSPGEAGPAKNHQFMLDNCNTDLLLRIDDDDSYEPTTIAKLLEKIEEGYDAVAPSCPFAEQGKQLPPYFAQGSLSNPIYNCTPQFFYSKGDIHVEHFTNTFMYDVKKVKDLGIKYSNVLSPVGHTEETQFSHNMYRNGMKMCVVGDTIAWHYKYPSGGIRQGAYQFFWESDSKEFERYIHTLAYPDIRDVAIPVLLQHGYGDTIMFINIVGELAQKYDNHYVVIGTNFKEVFDYHNITGIYKNVIVVTTHEFRLIFWEKAPFDPIYTWMSQVQWSNHIIDAYKEIYLNNNIWSIFNGLH